MALVGGSFGSGHHDQVPGDCPGSSAAREINSTPGFQNEEYRLTAKFYSEFIIAFCDALGLERHPRLMGPRRRRALRRHG
jgi:hypothetical protein